jgi:hypothetical protein
MGGTVGGWAGRGRRWGGAHRFFGGPARGARPRPALALACAGLRHAGTGSRVRGETGEAGDDQNGAGPEPTFGSVGLLFLFSSAYCAPAPPPPARTPPAHARARTHTHTHTHTQSKTPRFPSFCRVPPVAPRPRGQARPLQRLRHALPPHQPAGVWGGGRVAGAAAGDQGGVAGGGGGVSKEKEQRCIFFFSVRLESRPSPPPLCIPFMLPLRQRTEHLKTFDPHT